MKIATIALTAAIVVFVISGFFFFSAAFDYDLNLVESRSALDAWGVIFSIAFLILIIAGGIYNVAKRKNQAKKRISSREEARAIREKEILW